MARGYLTIEAAVLSKEGKMPLPIYERVFSAEEAGFISETHENLCCLGFLSEHFSKKCVRTLDRGFDANDYFRYFLKRGERFVIRVKKNRNVIYNGKICNIMDVAEKYKGNYHMDFKGRHGKKAVCKMSCIPVRLCGFPEKELVLVAVYGFGAEPMLLLSNLRIQEKKRLCHIIAKVYLMRWRIEEYFRFKKQQFELEDLRVMSLQSIRNMNLMAMLAVGYIGIISVVKKETIFLAELKECSKRIYGIPKFIFYTLGYAIERVLSKGRTGIDRFIPSKVKSQQLTLFEYFNLADSGGIPSIKLEYIPDGFSLAEEIADDLNYDVSYTNQQKGMLYFQATITKHTFQTDNEHYNIHDVNINNYTGKYFESTDEYFPNILYWHTENIYCTLQAPLPEEEMIKIAENVK